MRKKFGFLAFILLCLLVGIYFLSPKSIPFTDACAFCDPEVLERQKFYEDDLVYALTTHKPVFPGHCLMIPKRHVERFEELTDEEITEIGRVIKKVNLAVEKVYGTSSYLLLQKNGKEVGQSVPHVHFHYIPRKGGDDSGLIFVLRMFIANVKKPISQNEICENVEKLKKAISTFQTYEPLSDCGSEDHCLSSEAL